MAQRIGLAFLVVLLAMTAITAYRNVFTDDSALRATAESLARDTVGCRDCKAARIEGKRGVVTTSFDFTMQDGAHVAISCRRPYIAFGAYACTATKR
jgi:hypothetical protein